MEILKSTLINIPTMIKNIPMNEFKDRSKILDLFSDLILAHNSILLNTMATIKVK